MASTTTIPSKASSSPLRLIQHKKEALWFYSFISFGYDSVFNPGQYTNDMRDLTMDQHADLHSRNLKVVDVGGGTGFTTLGIVKHVDPENVTLIDQSPHQLDKARKKKALKGVKIMEGDAEDLPFPADTFDRYVSAGRFTS
jgi:MPBQ/MSBQ methyltransferase